MDSTAVFFKIDLRNFISKLRQLKEVWRFDGNTRLSTQIENQVSLRFLATMNSSYLATTNTSFLATMNCSYLATA